MSFENKRREEEAATRKAGRGRAGQGRAGQGRAGQVPSCSEMESGIGPGPESTCSVCATVVVMLLVVIPT